MINKLLGRIFGGHSEKTPLESAANQETALPSIGRKVDLIPVNTDVAHIVPDRSNIDETCKRIAERVKETLRFDRLAITIIDNDQDTYRNAYVVGSQVAGASQGQTSVLRDSFVSEVADSQRAILLDPQVQYPDQEAFLVWVLHLRFSWTRRCNTQTKNAS